MSGIILSIIVVGAFYINYKDYRKNILENFTSIQDTILYKLQTDSIVSNTWLSQMEASHKLVIHIEDNGTPFFFKGSWTPSTERETMIQKAKQAALQEDIDTTSFSSSSEQLKSSVLHLVGKHGEPAFASVSLIPFKGSFKSLTLIQFRPNESSILLNQAFRFLLIDILGILALLLVSSLFVHKAIKPVVESQNKQNEFIAAASHELRSPLSVIQTNASALLIEGTSPEHFVPKIVDECTRMSRLISDMLILASSDANTWSLQREELDTDTYFIDLYDYFDQLCQKREHNLNIELPDDSLPHINVDKDRLTQILSILIDNAISYSPKGSVITIRPYAKHSTFLIEVEDHGIGIPRDHQEHIFDRFYRVDKSRNDKTHFGLGLSVAKELIELLAGTITLKDTQDGGTTFVIGVPL
jgi:signal transduction histidine kinase